MIIPDLGNFLPTIFNQSYRMDDCMNITTADTLKKASDNMFPSHGSICS